MLELLILVPKLIQHVIIGTGVGGVKKDWLDGLTSLEFKLQLVPVKRNLKVEL
jgi:hypothetical protein